MIINNQKSSFKFISNNFPFFIRKKLQFSKPNITQAYIHIINHPYEVYKIIKKKNGNDQEISRNIFLNLDQKPLYGNTKILVLSSKKGWHTNTHSWTDANVVNSLKGKIISKKELLNNSYEVLSSIILHPIQSGVEIELDYDLIENFVKSYSYDQDDIYDEISSKEEKLDQYVQDIDTYDSL